LHSTKAFIIGMLKDTKADNYIGFLTGGDNFRGIVDNMYKANRKGAIKPVHYQAIRNYMVSRFNAKVIEGSEADDALACNQTKDTAIATIDKDLKMVAGKHYNYVTKEWDTVTLEEGTRWFYTQMLTGDSVDNICGIKGLGEKGAEKMLDAIDSKDWDALILEKYEEFHLKAVEKVDGFTEEEKELQKNYDFIAFANYPPLQRLCMNTCLLWMIQGDVKMPIDVVKLNEVQK